MSSQPHRISTRVAADQNPTKVYGHPIQSPKQERNLRIFFQNIKGLSHSHNCDDHNYYLSHMRDLQVDIAGFAETNSAWQHLFLQHAFSKQARKAGDGMAKTSFGSPTQEVNSIPPQETFQAGGTLTVCLGKRATAIHGDEISDDTALGRWSGFTLRGKHDNVVSIIITAYRTCAGTRQTAPLGSTFVHQEVEFYQSRKGMTSINPRAQFLAEIRDLILRLRDNGHAILLMLVDANGTLEDNTHLHNMAQICGLHDLHDRHDPPKSTCIGTESRRIDFMLAASRSQRQPPNRAHSRTLRAPSPTIV